MPPFDYVVMITEVCGLIYDMISKLINCKKRIESLISLPENLLLVLYRLVNKCLKLLITGMLNNVIFLGHTAPIKKGLKKKIYGHQENKKSKTT